MKKNAAPRKVNGQSRSLADLHKLCNEIKRVELTVEQDVFTVDFRRLHADERQKLDEIVDAVMPQIIKGATPDQDRIDYINPEFTRKKREANLKARSLALYWCVPELQRLKPDLKEFDVIRDFVQASFPEDVLDNLMTAVSGSSISLAEVVNFTSSSGSPES